MDNFSLARQDEPLVIIYEGPENAGKTTIKRIVNEMINHQSLSFERWTGTQYAYGVINERKVGLHRLLEMDFRMDLCFNCVLVLLFASPTFLKERKNTDPIEGSKYKFTEMELDELVRYFKLWYSQSPFRVKRWFDTSKESPEKIAKQIVEACRVWRPNLEIRES